MYPSMGKIFAPYNPKMGQTHRFALTLCEKPQMIKFSVIIPTFNRFDMVQRAINSVLSQTYSNYELIIVDDGSTDETSQIAHIFKDKIKFIQQENLGVSAARNKGIEISAHEYIAFLDSDDLWLPEKLQEHVNFIQKNPTIKIHQTAEKWFRNSKQVSPAKHHIKSGGDIFLESLKRCMITPSTVVLCKSVFEKYETFDTNLQACEDYDLWLRISFYENVGFINKHLAIRHAGHVGQLSEQFEALDRFRLYSIVKLLGALSCATSNNNENNTQQKISATIETLNSKASILKNGALKRKKFELAETLNQILEIKDLSAYSRIDFQNLLKVLNIEKDV